MKKYEEALAGLIVGGFLIIMLADVLRKLMGYLIMLAALLAVYALLFRRDR